MDAKERPLYSIYNYKEVFRNDSGKTISFKKKQQIASYK